MNSFLTLTCGMLVVAALGQCASYGGVKSAKGTKGQELIGPIDWFECERNGVFPDPDNCDQYIDCWEDVVTLWRCTDFMLFDIVYNGCNFAELVHCNERPRPTNVSPTRYTTPPTTTSNVSTTTTPAPPIDFTCPYDGVFAHEERCEYYYECWAGEPQLIHCQLDFLFDRRYDGCNYPELTDCDHRLRPGNDSTTVPPTITTLITTSATDDPVTSSDNPDPETEDTIATSPDGNGTTAAPPTTITTPESNVTTASPQPTTTKLPGFVCEIGMDGDFPDPEDCTAYYTCVAGIAYHQFCPEPLFFNPALDLCDFPENVDCSVTKK